MPADADIYDLHKTHKAHLGVNAYDTIAGDRIVVRCRKPDRHWNTVMASGNHHQFQCSARMEAVAVVLVGYKNVR